MCTEGRKEKVGLSHRPKKDSLFKSRRTYRSEKERNRREVENADKEGDGVNEDGGTAKPKNKNNKCTLA